MASLIVVGILLAIAGPSFAAFPFGQLYPFDIDSLLTCHVDNPNFGFLGEPISIPEELIRLPYTQVVRQPPHPNDIWLPGPIEYRIPPGIPSRQRLIEFLGADYDRELTSFSIPNRPAPRGCEILPSTEGSGGNAKVHISVDQDPTPFLSVLNPVLAETPIGPMLLPLDEAIIRVGYPNRTGDPSTFGSINFGIVDLNEMNRMIAARELLNSTNPRDELCPIWVGKCPLDTTWAELPDGYLPKFFAQGTCSNKNCSFPRGKHCEEDFSYVSYVTVLRWDCCFDKALRQIQWACGWRKVRVPILCDCMCACSEVFPENVVTG